MRMLDISPEGVRLSERNTNELAFVHSPGGAKPLETPPEVREEAKPTTEHKVGVITCIIYQASERRHMSTNISKS